MDWFLGFLTGIVVGAAGFCFAAWRASKAHSEASIMAECIARMCAAPSITVAKRIAEATRQELIVKGLWRSGNDG